jgi:predicted RNase H-like HicB family nuclease
MLNRMASRKGWEFRFKFEIDREADGRWIAEIPEVPGALAYGAYIEEAKAKAYSLALCALRAS